MPSGKGRDAARQILKNNRPDAPFPAHPSRFHGRTPPPPTASFHGQLWSLSLSSPSSCSGNPLRITTIGAYYVQTSVLGALRELTFENPPQGTLVQMKKQARSRHVPEGAQPGKLWWSQVLNSGSLAPTLRYSVPLQPRGGKGLLPGPALTGVCLLPVSKLHSIQEHTSTALRSLHVRAAGTIFQKKTEKPKRGQPQ